VSEGEIGEIEVYEKPEPEPSGKRKSVWDAVLGLPWRRKGYGRWVIGGF